MKQDFTLLTSFINIKWELNEQTQVGVKRSDSSLNSNNEHNIPKVLTGFSSQFDKLPHFPSAVA